MKKLVYASMLLLGLCSTSCQKEPEPIKVTAIVLDSNSLSLTEGETGTITATVSPNDAENKVILWTTSDSDVATVSNGTVTAIKEGKVTITATSDDGGKTATCVVNVDARYNEVEKVSLDQTESSLKVGGTVALTVSIKPDNATDKTVTWTSSDESVAMVKDGVVTAVKIGTATITAKAGNFSATCVITVGPTEVAAITLDQSKASLNIGGTVTLSASVEPDDATDKTITWTSSDESVASVKDGVVTAFKIGTANITAKSGNATATCTVSVVPIEVSAITLDQSKASLKVGEAVSLTAAVEPYDATDKTVVWSTSNAAVATVKNGVVTAVKVGTATITAKAGNKTATCVVTVVPIEVTAITLDKTEVSLKVGRRVTLSATVNPVDATDKTVVWSTSNDAVATVKDGAVSAVKVGTATITAKAGNKTATCTVTVVPTEVTAITLDRTELSLNVGETATLDASITPIDATDKTITWTTSDAAVATVRDGVVTAVNIGSAVITAKSGNKTATCAISVTPISVTSVSLDITQKSLLPDMQFKLTATVSPNDATYKGLSWESNNPGVASVDSKGNVTAISAGEAIITATSEDGRHSASCTVTVTTDISDFVYASYVGGAVRTINDVLQYGSQISFNVSNNSNKTITVKSVQLIDGKTGAASNVMAINSDISANSSSGWTLTVGYAGINSPIAKFVYTYNGVEYSTTAQYRSFSW